MPSVSTFVRGPAAVFEGESAVFYSRSERKEVSLVFTTPGRHRIPLAAHGLEGGAPVLDVRPLPPFVAEDRPAAERAALIQIYVWDGDRSTLGRQLEELGRKLGPRWSRAAYPVQWVLAGRQATRRNVSFAINELARRGYVLDIFSSVHGYPIKLADGEWRDVARDAGLARCRLFYTTACYGRGGEQEFRDAGVETYLAAEGLNFLSVAHMKLFFDQWKKGRTARASDEHAFRRLKGLAETPVLGLAARGLVHLFARSDEVPFAKEKFDEALEKSRPRVSLATDGRAREPARAAGHGYP
jgi:hypothetical protein